MPICQVASKSCVNHSGTSVLSTAIETVINSKPQSSNITGRDQVDIVDKTERKKGNCAQFATAFFKVNGLKINTAFFAARQFNLLIFSKLGCS